MTNQAQTFVDSNSEHFNKSQQNTGYDCSYSEIDNNELIELIQSSAVYVEDIMEQETYTFSDGSYITRNEEQYFVGNDINDFILTALENQKK